MNFWYIRCESFYYLKRSRIVDRHLAVHWKVFSVSACIQFLTGRRSPSNDDIGFKCWQYVQCVMRRRPLKVLLLSPREGGSSHTIQVNAICKTGKSVSLHKWWMKFMVTNKLFEIGRDLYSELHHLLILLFQNVQHLLPCQPIDAIEVRQMLDLLMMHLLVLRPIPYFIIPYMGVFPFKRAKKC